MNSALFTGRVTHQRLRPLRHRLGYRVFSLLLDLDELAALQRRLRCFSLGRFNLFGFDGRDHGDGSATPLREQIDRRLREAGLATGGRLELLCTPRMLGHQFNPLSVWFCHRPDGQGGGLQALIYEVHNTFGERHSYLLPVAPGAGRSGEPILQRCAKDFHVSPFLGMALDYRFRVLMPPGGDALNLSVTAADAQGPLLVAHYAASRRPLDDAQLLRVAATHPLIGLKVVAAIHWEALRLWLKRLPIYSHPLAEARKE